MPLEPSVAKPVRAILFDRLLLRICDESGSLVNVSTHIIFSQQGDYIYRSVVISSSYVGIIL